MNERPSAPAVARNREPILEVLTHELADRRQVLEIGSGTGEHAVFFAARMPWLNWQTSDLPSGHDGICAWIQFAAVANVEPPLALDVSDPPRLDRRYDAVFSANTAHIMSRTDVECMFALAGGLLPQGGRFCLYGPFNRDGRYTSDSNARFDASLRRQDPAMGIRDLGDLDAFGVEAGLSRSALYAMPANNYLAVWTRGGR